jgi:undecaprenyl diphosphate synthase
MAAASEPSQIERQRAAGLPTHVAIIMDGNGRWAKERGLSRQAGHRAGTENIRRIIEFLGDRGVPYLTLYAFSTENWQRPRSEVSALMRLVGVVIKREIRELHAKGARLLHLGSLDNLPSGLRKQVLDALELTKDNRRITVALAFDYGGRAEIVEAVRRIMAEGLPPEKITEESFGSYLYTAGLPDPDLIVRTAGEMRLSNFLVWQAAYAEYYSTPIYWPDFGPEEMEKALQAYSRRERRFGGVTPKRRGKSSPAG